MKIKAETLRILVVNFGTAEDPWNLFCGIDENRVVFFQYLHMFGLPAYFVKGQTKIELYSNNEPLASGIPYLSSGHLEEFRFSGDHKFKPDENARLVAFEFLDGDILEINKPDWDADDKPLSSISTRRSVGNNFHLVFHRDDIAKKIVEFSGMTYEEISKKSVIFENRPGESGRYISHF
jgi:hypothetical protein